MNTKGIKFLAVLAVLAMAFAAFAVVTDSETSDADANAAKIGDKEYATLPDAIKEVKNGETIVLLTDVASGTGIGLKAPTTSGGVYTLMSNSTTVDTVLKVGNSFTIDFNGKQYTATEPAVGSTGTETQALHLEKGLNIVLKNGTLKLGSTNDKLKMGIQNYSNLKLIDFNIDASEDSYNTYALSNNCGVVSIEGNSNITAYTGKIAFDACWAPNQGYPEGTQVTVNTTGTITGTVEFGLWGTNVSTSTLTTLTINGGIFAGALVVSEDLKTAALSNVKINGGAFFDLSALPYVQSGKAIDLTGKLTLTASTTPATIITGTTLNIVSGAGIAVGAKGGTEAEPTYALINNGTIDVLKGGALTGAANIGGEGTIEFDEKEVDPQPIENTTPAAVTDEIIADLDSTETQAIIEFPAAVTSVSNAKVIDTGAKEVAFVGTNQAIAGLNIAVATDSTSAGSISFSGFSKVSGQVTTGTGSAAQTITLTEVTGSFTISKGSIIIDGTDYSGSVTVAGGTELKLSGTVTAAGFTVKYDTTSTGTAKVTIEEGKGLEIKGLFTIDSDKIALQVNGKLFASGAGSISSKGNITVNDGGEIDSAIDDAGKITITANSGSKVSGAVTLDHAVSAVLDSTFIAYSGSDINGVTSTQKTQFIGKDAEGGKWSFGDDELLLENYNGTYNFKLFGDAITSINLVGINTVSYTAPSTYVAGTTLFGSQIETISTVQGSATLAINADLSAASGDSLANKFYVIHHTDGAIGINAVAVAIDVTGYNSDWTETQIAAGQFEGICANGLNLYNADLDVKVMAAYAAEGGIGVDIDAVANLDITSCEEITVFSSGTAIVVKGDFVVKDTIVIANGQLQGMTVDGNITVSNYALVTVVNGLVAGNAAADKVSISQESVLGVDDLNLYGALTNNGNVVLTGESIVQYGASITNKAQFTNSGLIGVYGTLTNDKDGTFGNDGNVFIYKNMLPAAAVTLTLPVEAASTGLLKLKSVSLAPANMILNADGTITIKDATLKFQKDDETETANVTGFEGTLTYSQVDNSYTLILATEDAAMSITYDDTKATKTLGEAYSLTLSGEVTIADTPFTLETNTSTTAIGAGDGIKSAAGVTTAALSVSGTFDNEDGIVYLYKTATPVAADGTFIGNYISAVDTTMAGKMTGTIYSKGDVTINGALEGDIYTAGAVSILGSKDVTAKVIGNVIMNNSDISKDFTLKGVMDGYLKYITEYNTVTSGTPVMQVFTATLTIDGTEKYNADNGMVITATIGKGATTTTAAVGGCFVLTKADALATGKTVDMALTEGMFSVPKSVTLPASYELVIEDDTTIEVAKTATFTIEGGLKVADGAERNYELVSIPVKYGKLAYVMMFDIAEGYTVFSNVEYALSNCDENSDLTVGSKTTVTSNVAIKAGVKVYVDNVELGIGEFDLSMDEGAQIILLGNAKVTFAATGSKTTLGVETLYYVSGTIVYDEDNVIAFTDVRFDAASSVTAIPATSTTDSKLGLDLHLNDGAAELRSGTANGAVDLNNLRFDLNGTTMKVSGKYTIYPDAVSEAAVTDAAEVTTKGSETPATVVVVNGVMKANANMDITGTYAGLGEIILADGKVVSVADGAVVAGSIGNGTDGFAVITSAGAYTITSVAKTTTVPAYVKVDGVLNNGAITAVGNTAVGTLALGYTEATATKEAKVGAISIPEGATLTVLTTLTANGVVGNAGTLNYKTEETPSYGTLDYEITFQDDGYTIYTKLNTALDLIEPGTEIVIEKNLEVADKAIPLGVSIVIAPGHYLTVQANKYLIIGEDTSALGAGATLTGAVVLENGAYVIDFVGSGSEIGVYTDIELTKAAAYNMFLVDDVAFATVYAFKSDMVLDLTPAVGEIDLNLLIPVVEGYYFDQWTLQNGITPADGQKLSAGPFTASMIASKVSVTFSAVAGINYYVDGELVNTLDAPVKVFYGATVTAKISDTSKYQGTPLVNGKAYILIDDEVSKIVGSGVEPIPVPPEPTPEPVEENTGLSLTDILLIVLVILIAIMVVILVLRLNRS